jgi:Leucine-rich repeat (LRR) protein
MRKFAVRTAFHVAMLYSGAMSSEFANHSILVHKVVPVLRAAERQVVDMANGLPEDLRQAFLELMAESHRLAAADPTDLPGLMPELSELPIPEDVEAQARDLILAGHAVPPHWVPAIRALNFGRTNLADATLLATLGNLQELSLNNTPVTDIAPLAALGNLQALYLNNTPVTDIAPLAALGKLRELDIQGTRVRDVSPLAHLRNLKIIGP